MIFYFFYDANKIFQKFSEAGHDEISLIERVDGHGSFSHTGFGRPANMGPDVPAGDVIEHTIARKRKFGERIKGDIEESTTQEHMTEAELLLGSLGYLAINPEEVDVQEISTYDPANTPQLRATSARSNYNPETARVETKITYQDLNPQS